LPNPGAGGASDCTRAPYCRRSTSPIAKPQLSSSPSRSPTACRTTSAARSAAAKLRRGLPDATATATRDLCDRIRLEQPLPSSIDRRTLGVLEDAVASATVVRLDYRDRHGVATRRDVEGAGFLGGGDGWYLGAWCRLRQDRRLFRLDRIERATLTKERATKRDLDDILGWLPHPTVPPR
jgi:predicted DNA-binding transcriptional regulator YafY